MAITDTGAFRILTRLDASAKQVASLDEAWRAEKERRDELIVQARDEGLSWSRIARAARCSMSRCVAIVSG